MAPFDLRKAKVAFTTRIVEGGNWKMVLEVIIHRHRQTNHNTTT
jgi:hypothetical protein